MKQPQPAARAANLAIAAGARPDDFTRAESRALFMAITEAVELGARTTEDVLEALGPELRAYAEWIGSVGAEDDDLLAKLPPQKLERHAAEALTALRLLNVRRELDAISVALTDDPGNVQLAQRVVALAAWIRQATRDYPNADPISRAALHRERRAALEVIPGGRP